MATFTAHSAIGQREDLTDIIYDISPTETPFMSSIGKTKATAVYHEWQTDSLAAATTANAAVEGADATSATLAPTVRLGNYCQIIQKTVQVSGTLDAVNKAGRKSEKAYQLAKASAELKRDLETILLANQGRSAGTSTTARKLGSVLSWIKTNSDVGSGGADPATIGVSTRTDGTQRTFTEALLKTVVSEVFVSGGSPKILMVGKLAEAIPEYADPQKGEVTRRELREFGLKLGFSEQELSGVYDSRQVLTLWKAMQYDKLVSSKPGITKKVNEAPKVLKPGVSKPRDGDEELKKLKARAKQTGRVADAARAFERFL